MDIHIEKTGSKGRYFTRVNGSSRESELTFSIASDHMIIADHTDVPAELKGQGVGKALFMRLVEDARKDGVTIVPLCPFVKSQFGKFPETRDVL